VLDWLAAGRARRAEALQYATDSDEIRAPARS
jgi:hypothetical protein